jgi:hypothetical protein
MRSYLSFLIKHTIKKEFIGKKSSTLLRTTAEGKAYFEDYKKINAGVPSVKSRFETVKKRESMMFSNEIIILLLD